MPDADPSNSFFWVEKAVINLTFQGVKGNPSDSKVYTVKVPCMETYGEQCPVLAEVRTWYKDDSLKEMANKYWKKRTYLFQGFVKSNPLLNTGNPQTEDVPPENPIRRFVITPSLFTVIKGAMMDPEIEELPTDSQRGLDFKIVKGTKGEWADYSMSAFARKETALTEAEQAAIEQYGLFDLKEFLPKKPSEAEQRIIKEMFEASVDGRPYDPVKWGAYYKPWGLDVGTPEKADGEQFESPRAASAPVVHDQSAPSQTSGFATTGTTTSTTHFEDEAPAAADEVKVPETSSKTNDILAMIRSRQGKTA